MGKTTDNDLLPAGTGPSRACKIGARSGPVAAGKKSSPGVPAGDRRDPEVPERPVRRRFLAEQTVAIVKEHLVDRVPISDLCDRHQILPTQFYQWQKQLSENGATACEHNTKSAGPMLAERQGRTMFAACAAQRSIRLASSS